MFVRWECDCVGLLLPPDQAILLSDQERLAAGADRGTCLVIWPCDHTPGHVVHHRTTLYLRQACESKDWEPLTNEEVKTVVTHLSDLIHEGQTLTTIRRLLALKG